MSDQEVLLDDVSELTESDEETMTSNAEESASDEEFDEAFSFDDEDEEFDVDDVDDEYEDDEREAAKRDRRNREAEARARAREEKRRKHEERERKYLAKEAKRKLRKDGIMTSEDGVEMPVIQFRNVSKEYENSLDEETVALDNVSFEVKKGEFVFIVGPSGSGKSTMIRLMMKEISPTEGTIFMAGRDLSHLAKNQVCKYRREIGIVFQDFRLLMDRNVYENVAFAQQVIGVPKRRIPREVAKMLALVGLSQKYKKRPTELSGGEQQRVALARALVNNPMILLADEPTGNLDPDNSRDIMALLEEINRRGTTVVVVTHDTEIVDKLQKRVIKVQDGAIVEDKKGGYIFG